MSTGKFVGFTPYQVETYTSPIGKPFFECERKLHG